MDDYKWRQITPENYHVAFLIQQSCHLFPWSEKVFKDCLSPPYFAYQLQRSQQTIGYYIGMLVADEATLMDIGVDFENRGHGLGRKLLEHFLQQCVELNTADIWLEVRESNKHAISLYKRAGFELIEQRKGYYQSESGRENGLIMRKSL